MPSEHDDTLSTVTYAGIGGAVICCAALEFFAGAALIGEIAAMTGFSTGLMYVALVGVTGILFAAVVTAYRRYRITHP